MSEQTKIQWADSTVNFWIGCAKVSAGCKNCYAEHSSPTRVARSNGVELWGGKKRQKTQGAVKNALSYNRKPWRCDVCGNFFTEAQRADADERFWAPCPYCTSRTAHRRRIFSLSLGDWLDPEVPIEWLAEMLDTIRQCDQVEWILCTKRPELWYERVTTASLYCGLNGMDETADWLDSWTDCVDMPERGSLPPNIILLTSVENQEAADTRIPELLKIPAARRGLSLEPLLGPVDLSRWIKKDFGVFDPSQSELSWLIVGGESGTNARPCNVEWIRSLVQQGQSAGVATFVKQMGAAPCYGETRNGTVLSWRSWPLRDKKGSDPAEWPEDLRAQQWPANIPTLA